MGTVDAVGGRTAMTVAVKCAGGRSGWAYSEGGKGAPAAENDIFGFVIFGLSLGSKLRRSVGNQAAGFVIAAGATPKGAAAG